MIWVLQYVCVAQENVLAEAKMMIPDTRQRLSAALQDLSNLVVSPLQCCLEHWQFVLYGHLDLCLSLTSDMIITEKTSWLHVFLST
jgi:hypothetical protein